MILVVDRAAEALPLFQELARRNIYFIVVITKNSKATKEMASIPESKFNEEFRKNEEIAETKISLKGIPFRAGVIQHKDGKRYGFLTNIPQEKRCNIQEIARLIPARWRRENKFEENKNGEHGDKIARYEFIDAPNIHLQRRYKELQEQLPKVEAKIDQRERELVGLRKRYEKKERTFKDRLRSKDDELKRLEERLRKAGNRDVFQGRLERKIEARDVGIQKYSTALSKLKNSMKLVTGKLKNEQARKEKIVKELENIDLEAEFFQLNAASTTFSIAVKEAVANANFVLTRQSSHDGQPMKVNRAKKVLYRLPGKIAVGSSTKIVELTPVRNRPLRKKIERLCDWLTEKQVEDTDDTILIFKVETT